MSNSSTIAAILSSDPNHHYFDTRVVSWDVQVDGQRATLGRITRGEPLTFPMDPAGEIFELACAEDGSGSPITVSLANKEGTVVHIGLVDVGHAVHLPGGAEVTFSADHDAYYLCTYPGEQPVRNGLVELSHVFDYTSHLLPGDSFTLEWDSFAGAHGFVGVPWNSQGAYQIENIDMGPHDRCIIDVVGTTGEAVFLGPGPMTLQGIEGVGWVRTIGLESVGGDVAPLLPGGTVVILPGSLYRIDVEPGHRLVARDTTPGFTPDHEIGLPAFLDRIRHNVSAHDTFLARIQPQGFAQGVDRLATARSLIE